MTQIDQLADKIVDGIRDYLSAPLALVFKGLKPEKAHPNDAASDLISCERGTVTLYPHGFGLIRTGSFLAIPKGHVGLVCPRSGLAAKHGVTVLNAPGVIDPSYRGEVGVVLINLSQQPYTVSPGDRIAQLLLVPTSNVSFLDSPVLFDAMSTKRGERGFGSTGTASPILPRDLQLNCESCGSPECREGCMT